MFTPPTTPTYLPRFVPTNTLFYHATAGASRCFLCDCLCAGRNVRKKCLARILHLQPCSPHLAPSSCRIREAAQEAPKVGHDLVPTGSAGQAETTRPLPLHGRRALSSVQPPPLVEDAWNLSHAHMLTECWVSKLSPPGEAADAQCGGIQCSELDAQHSAASHLRAPNRDVTAFRTGA